MKVCIVGLGYVGLTLAGRCLEVGHKVYGLELNSDILTSLRKGRAHFIEPGLDLILANSMDEGTFEFFDANRKLDINVSMDVIIITVGTPLFPGSSEPNLGYITSAIRSINAIMNSETLVVLRSTVVVGLTRSKVIPLLSAITGNEESDVLVAFCPERTLEGAALKELKELPQIISGNNTSALDTARTFFKTISNSVLEAESLESAELVKLFNNVYRDINFSIGNLFNDIAMYFNIDGIKAINLANRDYPRSNIAKPGLVGGPCLEKDSYILCSNIDDSDIQKVVLSARNLNESLEDKIINWVRENNFERIILFGMAFKGQPSTNDLRGSNSVNIARKLHSLGLKLAMFDPVASTEELESLYIGEVIQNIEIFEFGDSDCLLVLTNHNYFKSSEFTKVIKGKVVFDVWDVTKISNKITLGTYGIKK